MVGVRAGTRKCKLGVDHAVPPSLELEWESGGVVGVWLE